MVPEAVRNDIRSAMKILSGLPVVNVELWAKLARASATVKAWPLALECAESASSVIPEDDVLRSVRSVNDVPDLNANSWFWLGIAESIQGQVSGL